MAVSQAVRRVIRYVGAFTQFPESVSDSFCPSLPRSFRTRKICPIVVGIALAIVFWLIPVGDLLGVELLYGIAAVLGAVILWF